MGSEPSPDAVDAAISVLREHADLGGHVPVSDFLKPGMTGEIRAQAIAALQRADGAAEQLIRDYVRAALAAAYEVDRPAPSVSPDAP